MLDMLASIIFYICLSTTLRIAGKRQPYLNHYDKINENFTFTAYQPYDKIKEELLSISEKGNKEIMKTLLTIGKTFEGRDLLALQLQNLNNIDNKKTIVVDCGAHAREWIAPATCMYIIHKFSRSCCKKVLERFNWVFIPVLNPDGYVYTWKNNDTRMWRKNRSYTSSQLSLFNKTGNQLCIGTDINRNFDVKWGGLGAPINNPCYEMYAGSDSFSEKESSALASYLNKTKEHIIAYVSLHTYGQYWMTPYGFTKKRPQSYEELKRVATLAVESMRNFSGVNYDIGPSHDRLYPNSGSSVDWAYGLLNIPYAYIVEMMPNGKDGKKASFLAPPNMMVKNAKDLLEGIKTMALNLKT